MRTSGLGWAIGVGRIGSVVAPMLGGYLLSIGLPQTRLAQSREIVDLYDKWFQQRLPTGVMLDLPMSPQLEEIFRVEGVPY